MKQDVRKQILALLLISALLAFVSCGGGTAGPQADGVVAKQTDIAAIAAKIANDVGSVQRTVTAGDKGPAFVFEEYHTSRVGQLQIAAMLLRLHDGYGLKKIGLEGAIQSPKPIDASWFHNSGGAAAKDDREDVAVRMLSEGEISSAEFLALVFPDVEVHGIELAEQYNQTLDEKSSPELAYLLEIAQKTLPQQAIPQMNTLLRKNDKKQALEFLLSQDAWVKSHYEALKDTSSAMNCEQQVARMREIQSKADSVGAKIDAATRQAAEHAIKFYDTCSQRSATMVDRVLAVQGGHKDSPVAMIVGAAHTDRVAELLTQKRAAFTVIRPMAFNPEYANLSTEQFERKSVGKWVQNSPGTLGGILNLAVRKPSPVIGTVAAQALASVYIASLLIAKRARAGDPIPGSILDSVSNLPGLRVDSNSFEVEGHDVLFRVWAKDNQGNEKSVWARVGSLEGQRETMTLEQKLSRSISDLTATGSGGGGIRIPPTDLPPNSEPAKDEGPRDAKRGDVVISRIGRQELAVYAASRDDLKKMNRISN